MEELASFVKSVQELQQRVNRAAESILENERLTADLDDASAQVLVDWGVACAERIALSTAGLSDDEAEEAMYPRLRATRRLMSRVNTWVANRRSTDAATNAALLDEISTQAAIIYGDDYLPPTRARQDAFLRLRFEYADSPQQLIAHLRDLFESLTNAPIANRERKDDQGSQQSNH